MAPPKVGQNKIGLSLSAEAVTILREMSMTMSMTMSSIVDRLIRAEKQRMSGEKAVPIHLMGPGDTEKKVGPRKKGRR